MEYLPDQTPNGIPLEFKPELTRDDKLMHKGIFNPDLSAYYFTMSDHDFEHFNVHVIHKENGKWSEPQKAFFNSEHNDHGMCFSPDGNSIYFSSTRPVNIDGISSIWHIWKSERVNGVWTAPSFVDIPNLNDKLVSHPTIANSGTLYFHSSKLDYSEMDLYRSKQVNGKFGTAEKLDIPLDSTVGKCTPFISPDEKYILFAAIGQQLDLYISFNDGKGNWTNTKRLSDTINNSGQGNPYVTPDEKFLFFTTGEHQRQNWKVNWVNVEEELNIDL